MQETRLPKLYFQNRSSFANIRLSADDAGRSDPGSRDSPEGHDANAFSGSRVLAEKKKEARLRNADGCAEAAGHGGIVIGQK